jgi:hypothetical protein
MRHPIAILLLLTAAVCGQEPQAYQLVRMPAYSGNRTHETEYGKALRFDFRVAP